MNDRQRLEQLMALRERRERRAEAALRTQQRRYREESQRLDDLADEMARQRSDFDRSEQAWFEAMQGAALSARELEQARQSIDDHYRQHAELEESRRAADRERHRLLAERERCADEWTRRARARQALGTLLERRRRRDRLAAEGRIEMDHEDLPRRGGH